MKKVLREKRKKKTYIYIYKSVEYVWKKYICAEKAPSQGSGYMELHETMCILIFQFILL